MELPLVSCVCPTFGKVKHLEEAVYSFLIQSYPNKELIIFNNYDAVDIVFDHPEVTVINYKGKITDNTAECRNLGNQFARGKYIMTWDDDDIYLKHRIKLSVKALSKSDKVGYISGAFYSEEDELLKGIDIFLSNSLIEREYLLANPYKEGDGDDQYMYNRLLKEDKLLIDKADTSIQYIYRWNTNTYHISGAVGMTLEENRNKMIKWANSLNLPTTLPLSPYWARDYQLDVDNFIA